MFVFQCREVDTFLSYHPKERTDNHEGFKASLVFNFVLLRAQSPFLLSDSNTPPRFLTLRQTFPNNFSLHFQGKKQQEKNKK